MPGRTLSRLLSSGAQAQPYICPACTRNAAATRTQSTRNRSTAVPRRAPRNGILQAPKGVQSVSNSKLRRTYASHSSLASTTAINAPSTVPPVYRDLNLKLLALQDEASNFVDLSRIQLAARSLESEHPVVRVALLGLGTNGAQAARKLARVLLSDALGDEEAWEQEVLDSWKDGRSLLLRYGDSEDVVQHSPLLQTMHIPSPYLKRHNVEILVTTLNASGSTGGLSDAELEEAILVPTLTTPNAAGGRVGFVRYPVHKALVVAEGITGAVEYGRLPRFLDKAELITSALSLPLRPSTGTKSAEQTATDIVVDVDLATHALNLFRTSKANGAQFSEEWQTSRLSGLSKWVAGPPSTDTTGMPPAVRSLLNSTLLNASATLERTESEQASAAAKATIPDSKRASLDSLITHFSADWHRDLQINLTQALTSRTWRRTAWFRLLWRIDDVSVSASDILRQSWLTEAEQTLAFISGRIEEAGLATSDGLREAGPATEHAIDAAGELKYVMSNWQPKAAAVIAPPTRGMRVAELFQEPALIARVKEQSGVNAAFNPPWPRTVHLAREQMLHTLVPDLHRGAQTLLLSTLSTAGGASALGAWIYLATTGSAVQSAGAIAALGTVWSLRQLQTLWGKEREAFAMTVRENGRRVLAEVETHLRRLVKEGGRVSVKAEDVESWQRARRATDACRRELKKVK